MATFDRDARIRLAALRWCEELRAGWGDHVPASAVSPFPFEGESIHLRGQQGIFRPRQLSDGPLSIRSALDSPYNDEVREGGTVIRYDFAPQTRRGENDGLKRLAGRGTPLIYLIQVAPKSRGVEYLVVSPVFVTGWDDRSRTFSISMAGQRSPSGAAGELVPLASESEVTQAYRLQEVKSRLHQAHFRRLVLDAYRHRCAVCELRVRPLLDAAHILPDSRGGRPVVQNGLGLCALHHRAMDRGLLRVLPSYTIEIDREHIPSNDSRAQSALLEHHGRRLWLPRDESHWPSSQLLQEALVG